MVFEHATFQRGVSGYEVLGWSPLGSCVTQGPCYPDVAGDTWCSCSLSAALPQTDCAFGGAGVWHGNHATPADGERFARVRVKGNGLALSTFPASMSDGALLAEWFAHGGKYVILTHGAGTEAELRVTLDCAVCLVDFDQDATMRIGCAGDSNTLGPDAWCERAAPLMPVATVVKGAEVLVEPTQFVKRGFVGAPVCQGIGEAFAAMLVEQGADVVVAAFGTNDLIAHGHTPAEVVDCYEATRDFLGQRQLFVALTPPVHPPFPDAAAHNLLIDELNALLRAAFPAERIVDFHDGFTPDLYASDGLHFNAAGQQKRAERAVEALGN